MQVLNTLGRIRQDFEPISDGKVFVYVCGATVQSNPHVGHGRSAVAFDVIRRYLTYAGYDVTYVRNITDIDDKIIAAAADQDLTVEEVAARAAERFQETHDALGVLRPDIEPKATEHIPEIVAMIENLIAKGHAYAAEGDVYFIVRSFDDYGQLANRDVDELLSGARIATGDIKRDPLDFALWKAAKPGEPSWDSPWGAGRPGWHIECSAMAQRYLGETFDIHGGGTDLVFPHHENERAQSQAANGVTFAKYWLHNGMLTLSGQKMAKSTGHLVALDELISDYPPLAVRLFYLRAQYRSNLEFSIDLIEDAAAAYERLMSFRRRNAAVLGEPDVDTMDKFHAAMDDDFNTPEALGVLFDAVREANRLADAGSDASRLAGAAEVMIDVLGLLPMDEGTDDLVDPLNELLAAIGEPRRSDAGEAMDVILSARTNARQNADWSTADKIRDALSGLGIVVEDGTDGVSWHRK